jgi:hypothetical protein
VASRDKHSSFIGIFNDYRAKVLLDLPHRMRTTMKITNFLWVALFYKGINV